MKPTIKRLCACRLKMTNPETPAGYTGPQIGLGDRGTDPAGALVVRHTSRLVYQGNQQVILNSSKTGLAGPKKKE